MTAPDKTEAVAKHVVDAAMQVHRALGPGLLESVYEECLVAELWARGMVCERQKTVSIMYRDRFMEAGFRLDLLVEDAVIVELKAVESVLPLHEVQLYTYLKLTGKRLGLLINFNVPLLKQGIRRVTRVQKAL